jgi:hypothetical protein
MEHVRLLFLPTSAAESLLGEEGTGDIASLKVDVGCVVVFSGVGLTLPTRGSIRTFGSCGNEAPLSPSVERGVSTASCDHAIDSRYLKRFQNCKVVGWIYRHTYHCDSGSGA